MKTKEENMKKKMNDGDKKMKQKKMKRVTITLMNRALKPILDAGGNIDKKHPDYFSVQSENHIWWLGSFEVMFHHFSFTRSL